EIVALPERLHHLAFAAGGNLLVGTGDDGRLRVLDGTSVFDDPPRDPVACNDLAWSLVVPHDVKPEQARRAVELAENAVEALPQDSNYWNTLGVAHYRTGDWQAARQALEKSLQLRGGDHSANHFFLAMVCWHQGDKELAREWYRRGDLWLQQNAPQDEEMLGFGAEAAAPP